MLGPLDIHQYLLEHDVHHEIVRLPRPAANAEHLAEVLGVTPRRCLAIYPFHALTPAGDILVLVLAPADEVSAATALVPALSELLRDRLGPNAELTIAGAALVSRRTDYVAGHLAPLLLPDDVIVVSTRGIVELATSIIYTATGDGGTALGIGATDLLNLSRAIVLPSDAPADNARAERGFADTVDHIDLDPIAASPLTSTPITIPLPSESLLGDDEPRLRAVTAARVPRRATRPPVGDASPLVPPTPAIAATAS
jgi:Cys-tRNA(Pro)/Cys-tRNA(Cys) deacylase